MNYVGHVTAAAATSEDPDVLLGAALPDLVPSARIDRAALPGGVAAGMVHHHGADAAFHADARFRDPVAELRRRLALAGMARGTRRAVAHVGVELLIDDALLAVDGAPAFAGVWARLTRPDDVVVGIVRPDEQERWVAGLDRLTSQLDPWSHTGARAAAERLEHVLARRPRLAMGPGDRERATAALAAVVDEVAAVAPALVADVAAAAHPTRRRHT